MAPAVDLHYRLLRGIRPRWRGRVGHFDVHDHRVDVGDDRDRTQLGELSRCGRYESGEELPRDFETRR
jgi:hypothetical protein